MLLSVEHRTTYRYARPVRFGTHRLMIRAIEGHDVQIRKSGLTISVPQRIRWMWDVFHNSVALVEFLEPASELQVVSALTVEQFNTNPFDFVLEPQALQLPFVYRPEELPDVSPYLRCHHPENEQAIRQWIRPFVDTQGKAGTTEFFTALTKSMPLFLHYAAREEPGVQTPGETLKQRTGSCRDFTLLFMETARLLGVAARFVSGYLCRADAQSTLVEASDATHAWAELYLPGAGWKGFDPTSGVLAADYHVRTAVTRTPAQAVPVGGTYEGSEADYLGMEVKVNAARLKPEDARP